METAKVLVVEDEAIVAMDIQDNLKSMGYEIAGMVDTGEEAMSSAASLSPDLVLMDIKLKGEADGVTAAAYVRDKLNLPVIFLTSYADEGTLRRAKVTLPYGYILKPFDQAELRMAIEIALHRHKTETGRSKPTSKKTFEKTTSKDNKFSSSEKQSPADILRRIEPFSQLPVHKLESLGHSCSFYSFKSGDSIAYEGEEDPSGFIVTRGRVAMLKSSLSGKELIVELLPPGDIFGLLVAMESLPYPLTARAQTPTEILWVPKSTLNLLLEEHPDLYREFAKHMSQRLRTSHDISRGLAYDRVEVRIAATLSALVPKFSTSNSNGADGEDEIYTIDITRQELADLTGTSPETAIRITKAMERDGLLDLSRPCIIKILDLERLSALCED